MITRYLLFLFLCFLLFTSCTLLESEDNQIITEVSNPKQSKKEILFLKGGNATVDNSLQIKLVGNDKELDVDDVGNVLTTDSNYGQESLDSSAITLNWKGNDTLVVDFDRGLRTFTKKLKVEGVTIIYKEKARKQHRLH